MKGATFEEHYVIEDTQKETMNTISAGSKGIPIRVMLESLEKKTGFINADELSRYDKRVQSMNNQDVQIQVLLYGNGSLPNLAGQEVIELCQKAGDQLANYIAQYPSRFVGFVTLPINEPEAAAREFKHYINDLGFKGTLIMGRAQDSLLDRDKYDIIFRTAENLDVPIYLHPASVNSDIYRSYYKGNYPEVTTATFTCFGYGRHIDVGIHAIHLALSGTFDRCPELDMTIGHWGELIPFSLERMDEALFVEHLDHPVSYYSRSNFHITPSGMLTKPQFDLVKKKVDIDRTLYAVDYPHIESKKLGMFLDELDLTDKERRKISYTNDAKLLDLSPNN